MEFIKDKWYKVTLFDNYDRIFKYINSINAGNTVNLENGFYSFFSKRWNNVGNNEGFNYSSIIKIVELHILDVQEYLPDNHPDKLLIKSISFLEDLSYLINLFKTLNIQ